ncbi:hypothetical protein ACFX5K_06225 [Rickettsiales bacterium LUAb2]
MKKNLNNQNSATTAQQHTPNKHIPNFTIGTYPTEKEKELKQVQQYVQNTEPYVNSQSKIQEQNQSALSKPSPSTSEINPRLQLRQLVTRKAIEQNGGLKE